MAALFKIGEKDYTRDIRVPGYTVNRLPSYYEWTDANRLVHRDIARYQIAGEITICFRRKPDYLDFIHTIRDYMQLQGFVPCELYINNEDCVVHAECFIDLAPANILPLVGSTSDALSVTIVER